MERTTITSQELASIGYCFDCHVLEVAFHTGHIYQYHAVPLDVFTALLGKRLSSKSKTPSYGATFNRMIRDEVRRKRYEYTELGKMREREDRGQFKKEPDWACDH